MHRRDERLRRIFPTAGTNAGGRRGTKLRAFTCEPFLRLPHNKHEILSELPVSGDLHASLLRFFEKTGRTDALIKIYRSA